MLQEHLTASERGDPGKVAAAPPRPAPPHLTLQREILAGAMVELLWRCGGREQAVLALPEVSAATKRN